MKKSDKIENTYIAVLAVMIAIVIAILGLNVYSNLKNVESDITVEELAKHELNDIESASSSIGNNVEQSENVLENNNSIENNVQTSVENMDNTINTEYEEELENTDAEIINENSNSSELEESNKITETNSQSEDNANNTTENILENENTINTSNEETKRVTFIKPVEGKITKEYAKDSLVYSETLAEWTTHFGIDIKADKTTVVKAAADGIVKSIKNDPRYGLTVIVEHEEGFQTIYSNLLSTEFVVEGENVKQGQSIGTVGNTAIFEFVDEPHLHFELVQHGEYVDPTIYIK